MKKILALLLISALIVALGGCGGKDQDEPVDQEQDAARDQDVEQGFNGTLKIPERAGKAYEAAKDKLEAAKKEFTQSVQKQVSTLDEKMGELREKVENTDAWSQFQGLDKKLDTKMGQIQDQLDQLQDASKDTWDDIRNEIEEYISEAKSLYQQAVDIGQSAQSEGSNG